jgi:prevent-host-death family protein
LYKISYTQEEAMHVVGYSAARQGLAKLMDSVVDDRRPVIVTRAKASSVVMIALEEYEAMAETLHDGCRRLLPMPRLGGSFVVHVRDRTLDCWRCPGLPRVSGLGPHDRASHRQAARCNHAAAVHRDGKARAAAWEPRRMVVTPDHR